MLDRLRSMRKGREITGEDGETWLIVGLGNPGRRYEGTRHNAGFMVVDRLFERLSERSMSGTARRRFQAHYVELRGGDKRIVLVKPETFMNASGAAVGQLVRWYKTPLDRILIIYDDLDLPFGAIRLRAGGGPGGHNGVDSIIKHLRSQEFPRLRVGISRPRAGSTVPYVLARFNAQEQRTLPEVIDRAADAALYWLDHGITAAMNEYNRHGGRNRQSETTSLGSGPDS